jgi:hypothetical protein
MKPDDQVSCLGPLTGPDLAAAHDPPSRHCPKCGSDRLHHSHRRGPVEQFLYIFGTQIRRCHACRLRYAWFQFAWFAPTSIRLADDSKRSGWSGAALLGAGFVVCVGFLWWMITRFTEWSG